MKIPLLPRRARSQCRAITFFCATLLALGAANRVHAETLHEIAIFEAGEEIAFYDPSSGSAKAPSQLTLSGPFTSKLSIVSAPGRKTGLLEWTAAAGGDWKLVLAAPGWGRRDLSAHHFLEFSVNSPAAIAATNLPRLHLQSSLNFQSSAVDWQSFFPEGIDADSNTWQQARIPLSAFGPGDGFSPSQFKAVVFSHGVADSKPRTLWLQQVSAISTNVAASTNRPASPRNLVARTGDRSVALHWDGADEPAASGFHVYRSLSSNEPPTRVSQRAVTIRSFADMEVTNGQRYFYRITALNKFGESAHSELTAATPHPFSSDAAFLDLIQQTAFDYFWYEANPRNGLVRDRSRPYSTASIAATGFGLTAIGIGIDRGWVTRVQGRERVLTTLKTFWNAPQGPAASGVIGYKGWFYHFLEMDTAARAGVCELSSIDTALLLGGVLYAKQYFGEENPAEKEIRRLATAIFDRVDWTWMANDEDSLSHGWRPDRGFIEHRWIGYNEAMILYLLGMGSSKNPLPARHWQSWTSRYKWETHFGYDFVKFPPLFGHQYSHCWIDFRGIADDYMREKGLTYFENSRRATLAQRAYGMANESKGYSSNVWGWTACDGPGVQGRRGYSARGTPPPENEDGTIAPTAAGGSMAFTPEYSLPAFRHFYDQFRDRIWTGYGFRDAFNLEIDWWGTDVLGIDQGPILLMVENHRSEKVWRLFMKNPEIQRGLKRAGFRTFPARE